MVVLSAKSPFIKLGLLRKVPVITGVLSDEALTTIVDVAKSKNSMVVVSVELQM